jgi:hypothetical protein
MPRFRVDIHGEGEDLMRALATLNGAGIPTIGPVTTEWVGNPASRTVDDQMSAYLKAPNADDAEARVRATLPEGDYTVEAHERDDD